MDIKISRRLLDGVAMPGPHPTDALVDFHTGQKPVVADDVPPPHDQIRPRRRPDRAVIIKIEALPPSKHGAQTSKGRDRRVHAIFAPGHVEVLAERVRDAAAQAALDLQRFRDRVVRRPDDVGVAPTQARIDRAARPYDIGTRADEPRLPRHPR